MLTEIDAYRPPPAYRVPWQVDRTDPAHPRVGHRGAEPACLVRVFISDDERPPSSENWGLMLPGESCELCLCDRDLTRVLVSVAWFRAGSDDEYLWRFSI